MPDWASDAPSPSSPTLDSATGMGIVRLGFSMPYAVAVARMRSAPTWSASCANGPLQDFVNAVSKVTVGPGPHRLPS